MDRGSSLAPADFSGRSRRQGSERSGPGAGERSEEVYSRRHRNQAAVTTQRRRARQEAGENAQCRDRPPGSEVWHVPREGRHEIGARAADGDRGKGGRRLARVRSRKNAKGLEPRQGLLPEGEIHEGRRDALLHTHFRFHSADDPGSTARPETVPKWDQWRNLLPAKGIRDYAARRPGRGDRNQRRREAASDCRRRSSHPSLHNPARRDFRRSMAFTRSVAGIRRLHDHRSGSGAARKLRPRRSGCSLDKGGHRWVRAPRRDQDFRLDGVAYLSTAPAQNPQ